MPFMASAQSVAPSGEAYTSPGLIAGYNWAQGVTASSLDVVSIPYAGQEEWAAEDPMVCRNACEAFLTCKAFLFTEPVTPTGEPVCRILSDVTEPVIAANKHLYTRAD